MTLRLAVIGLMAGTFLAVPALATDQRAAGPPQVNADAQSGSEETSDTAEATRAAPPANAEGTADAGDATADAATEVTGPAEDAGEANSTEEPAASAEHAAMDMKTEKGKPFDPHKAKPKQIEAYNATVEPDDRIVCRRDRDTAATGARFSQKVCRTVRQWRELGR